MDKRQASDALIKFLNSAPTPFHSVAALKEMLENAGAKELCERKSWKLEKGGLYYFVKDATLLCAFKIGQADLQSTGFHMAGAHHDAPGFRIKPNGSRIDLTFERLVVEPYGGLIARGWFDRPLGLAGRICVREGDTIAQKLIRVDEPVLIIPSPAIHIQRDINENGKVSYASDMLPVLCENFGGEKQFMAFLAKTAGVQAEDILSYELTPFDVQPACYVGLNQEFISAPHIDDEAMVHAAFAALLAEKGPYTTLAVAYDHEEVGSGSTRGARTNAIMMTMERICAALGLNQEETWCAITSSVMFSADMAHATHPAHVGKAESSHKLVLNRGPVLKSAQYQSYATSSRGSALFKLLCKKHGIPYQVFSNHADARGGGTIGAMFASAHGVTTVDIGNPMLSMHAVRELAGAGDQADMIELFKAVFEEDTASMLCD